MRARYSRSREANNIPFSTSPLKVRPFFSRIGRPGGAGRRVPRGSRWSPSTRPGARNRGSSPRLEGRANSTRARRRLCREAARTARTRSLQSTKSTRYLPGTSGAASAGRSSRRAGGAGKSGDGATSAAGGGPAGASAAVACHPPWRVERRAAADQRLFIFFRPHSAAARRSLVSFFV